MKFKSVLYKDLIEINIYLCTLCRFKCPYCYARKDFKASWGKIISKDTLNSVFKAIKSNPGNFSLSFLGGEPTLYPHLKDCVTQFAELSNVAEILLYTNGSAYIDTLPKTTVIFAYHPTEDNCNFKDNVLRCPNPKRVALSLYRNFDFDLYRFLKEHGIEIEPTFITVGSRSIFPDVIPEEQLKVYDLDGRRYNAHEVLKGEINHFKGWRCYINSYEVSVEGKVTKECSGEPYTISDLSRVKYDFIECPFECCRDPCLWDYPKQMV